MISYLRSDLLLLTDLSLLADVLVELVEGFSLILRLSDSVLLILSTVVLSVDEAEGADSNSCAIAISSSSKRALIRSLLDCLGLSP